MYAHLSLLQHTTLRYGEHIIQNTRKPVRSWLTNWLMMSLAVIMWSMMVGLLQHRSVLCLISIMGGICQVLKHHKWIKCRACGTTMSSLIKHHFRIGHLISSLTVFRLPSPCIASFFVRIFVITTVVPMIINS